MLNCQPLCKIFFHALISLCKICPVARRFPPGLFIILCRNINRLAADIPLNLLQKIFWKNVLCISVIHLVLSNQSGLAHSVSKRFVILEYRILPWLYMLRMGGSIVYIFYIFPGKTNSSFSFAISTRRRIVLTGVGPLSISLKAGKNLVM